MPIASFSSFADGLDRDEGSRDHFISNINLEDDRLWVPHADGVWFQPCHFNLTSGGFSVVLKGLPGSKIGAHYHVGTVLRLYGYGVTGDTWNMTGLQSSGSFIYEPAGEAPAGYHEGLSGTDGDLLRSWRRLNLSGQVRRRSLCSL